MNSFNEFAEPRDNVLVGSKVDLKDILGKEIVVCSFMLRPSKFETGDCLYLQIKLNDEYHVVFTTGKVLMDQVQRYKDKMPFKTTIRREGASNRTYYTFT